MRTLYRAVLITTAAALCLPTIACRSVSRTCSSCCVSGWKDTMAGVDEGWEGGREQGASLDGAELVFNWEDFADYGRAHIEKLVPTSNPRWQTSVTVVLENESEVPVRMAELKLSALDLERFALDVDPKMTELTVPPLAKKRLTFSVAAETAAVDTIRLWSHEMGVKAKMRRPSIEDATPVSY